MTLRRVYEISSSPPLREPGSASLALNILTPSPIPAFLDKPFDGAQYWSPARNSRGRSLRRAVNWLLERPTRSPRPAEHVPVMYGDTPVAAAEFPELDSNRLPGIRVDISPVSGVVGGHTGPGLPGIAVRWRIS